MVCRGYFQPGEVIESWVAHEIDVVFRDQVAAEQSWPAETDGDRLDQCFHELNEAGIIALQNADNTPSDGITEVTDVYHQKGGESGRKGCFICKDV